jgi:hypothetical protein
MLTLLLATAAHAADTKPDKVFHHGFRLGYAYVGGGALPDPNLFVFGYETSQRIVGGEQLDVVMVENLMISGLNQSFVIPSTNLIPGVEIARTIQLGVGVNLTTWDPHDNYAHMILAVGYMPEIGEITVPLHLSYIPDVDGAFRVAATTGVNW